MNTTKNKHSHTYLYGYSAHCTLYTYIKKADCTKTSHAKIVRGRLCLICNKKVFFDFAVILCSIGAPDMLKMFAR